MSSNKIFFMKEVSYYIAVRCCIIYTSIIYLMLYMIVYGIYVRMYIQILLYRAVSHLIII